MGEECYYQRKVIFSVSVGCREVQAVQRSKEVSGKPVMNRVELKKKYSIGIWPWRKLKL